MWYLRLWRVETSRLVTLGTVMFTAEMEHDVGSTKFCFCCDVFGCPLNSNGQKILIMVKLIRILEASAGVSVCCRVSVAKLWNSSEIESKKRRIETVSFVSKHRTLVTFSTSVFT